MSLSLNPSRPRIRYATTSKAREMVGRVSRQAAFAPNDGSAGAARLKLVEVFGLPLPDDAMRITLSQVLTREQILGASRTRTRTIYKIYRHKSMGQRGQIPIRISKTD